MRTMAVVIAALALAGTAHAEAIYGDANGESASSGLPTIDVDTVHVSNDPAAGTLTFQVKLAGAPALTGKATVMVGLWPDGHGTSGAPAYTLAFGPGAAGGVTPSTGSYSGGVATLTVRVGDIGGPASVAFEALAVPDHPDRAAYAEDVAPEAGTWSYTLSKAEPPAPTATTVSQVSATFSAGARPGRAVRVSGLIVRLSDGTAGRVTAVACVAHLGMPLLKGTGAGGCTFLVPKGTKAKALDITTTGTYRSETVSSSDRLPIG